MLEPFAQWGPSIAFCRAISARRATRCIPMGSRRFSRRCEARVSRSQRSTAWPKQTRQSCWDYRDAEKPHNEIMETRISARNVARNFSSILDRVRDRREAFIVEQDGETVCRIVLALPVKRTLADLVRI